MTSARDTYTATLKAAAVVKTATLTANQTAFQETINQNGVNVGYNLQTGNYANFAAGVKSAIQAKRDADFLALQTKQAVEAAARDALRASGTDSAAF